MRKNLKLLVTAIMSVYLLTLGVQIARTGITTQISTDRKLYSVGAVMNLSGTGFTPGSSIYITVVRPDQQTDSVTPNPVSDGTGAFTATYQPPMIPGRYKITATDGTNSATTAVTEADAIGYNKNGYVKGSVVPEDQTGTWSSGNQGSNYTENQWTFDQYEITGISSAANVPSFDIFFNHYQSNTNAVFIDALANFRACVDCSSGSFTTGPDAGMLDDSHPLPPPGDTTNWKVLSVGPSGVIRHPNRPLYSTSTGTGGAVVLTGSTGFCSSDGTEPINTPAEFHCFRVDGPSLASLFTSTLNSGGTHTISISYNGHLAASFVWGNGVAGVGGQEGHVGDCSSIFYARPFNSSAVTQQSSFEPQNGDGCSPTGIPIYGADDYAGWTTPFHGVGFATGSSRHWSMANQTSGPSGAIEIPIPTVAAPNNTIVIVKETVPSNAVATFQYTGALGSFSLSNPFPSQQTFNGIAPGVEYDVTEGSLSGWTLTNLSCVASSGFTGSITTNVVSGTAGIAFGALDSGKTVTCTYHNVGTGHIVVTKHTTPASGTGFNFTTSGTGYTNFSLNDGQSNTDGGTVSTTGLVPGNYTVSEDAKSGWSLTSRSCSLTTTGSGTSTFPGSSTTSQANITLGAGDTVTCVYNNSQPAGSISVAANGVNEIGHSHTFTITATQVPNGATPASTANITYSVLPAPGSVSSTCGASVPFSGNTASCTVTINNSSAGLFTINGTAVFTVGGVTITKTTDSTGSNSGPATKEFVDARIVLSPLTATNEVTQPHTITATVTQNDGLTAGSPGDGVTGFGPAPNGTVVNFSLLNNTANAAFVGGVSSCTISNGLGTCTVQINSTTAGGVDIHATTTFSVGGVSLTRASGDGLSGDSANAHKDYISAGTTLTFNAAASSPLTVEAGATVTIVVTEKNVGSGPLHNVNVTGGGSCATFTGGASTLAAGAQTDFTCTFTSAGGANAWSADGHGLDELNNAVPSTGEHAEGSVRGVVPATTLVLKSQTPSGANVETGTLVTIVVTETNTGNGPLHNVSVSGGGKCSSFTGGATTLAAGAGTDYTCTFTAGSGANAWSADGHGLDELNNAVPSTNEHAQGSVNGLSPATTLTLKSQTPSGSVIEAGTSVTIVVTETNTGNDTISNVSVSGGGKCASFSGGATTLAPGAATDYSCTFTAGVGTNSWFADGHGKDTLGNDVPSTNEHASGSFTGVLSTLIVVKNTVGGNGTFNFAGTGSGVTSSFSITTSGGTNSATFAAIPSGPKSVTETVPTGWDGNTTNVACSETVAGATSSVIGSLTTGKVAAGGTVAANVTLGLGATVTCTFTNSLLPTINIIKYATSLGGPFNFNLTGPSPETPALTVSSGNSAETGVHSINIGDYTFAEDQATLPAGFTMTDLSCTKGTGSLPNSNNIPTLWSFTAAYGDAIVCEATNSNVQTTRTQGFWATHTALANNVWNGTAGLPDETPLGADAYLCTGNAITAIATIPPTPVNQLMGGFWSNISQKAGKGGKRSPLDQARMQMLQQYLAAVLNVHAFGSTPSGITLASARADYCSGNLSAIQTDIGLLGTFNTSGDALPFTPGASATAQESKKEADLLFWDITYR